MADNIRRVILRRVPRGQKMLKGHLPRVTCHQVYQYTKTNARDSGWNVTAGTPYTILSFIFITLLFFFITLKPRVE